MHRSVQYGDQVFLDGDRVYHQQWDTYGTVHVFNDNNPRTTDAEVQWDNTDTADELDLVADHLQLIEAEGTCRAR